jgi:D-glycero-D-manno-heptose 1,7-bisphosphate phosphatase
VRPAAFLDRDGTVIDEVNYLARPDQVRVLEGARESLLELRQAGYALVLVTNQAGVARGYFPESAIPSVHAHLEALLGLRFDDIRWCPHHPDGVVPELSVRCACRKPAPGMLLAARDALGLDLSRSFVVGDKASDLEAGRALDLPGWLVRTGHGRAEEADAARAGWPVLDDLRAVVDVVLGRTVPAVTA